MSIGCSVKIMEDTAFGTSKGTARLVSLPHHHPSPNLSQMKRKKTSVVQGLQEGKQRLCVGNCH